jgi:protein-S-isoprenylcysteine O-methyltransferase
MYASWMFFADRIPYEESLLLSFFGNTYLDYQRRTPLGLPFIKKGSAAMMMNYDSD